MDHQDSPVSATRAGQSLTPPAYDRSRLIPGIIHLGLGGFARAHLAAYLHDLMLLDPAALRWGIVGVGLRETDRPLLAALAAQDHLYTLVERDGDGERRTVIGSLAATIDASTDASELLRAAAAPSVAIVSLTVTQQGYCLGGDQRLDLVHPAIARDLRQPGDPRSAIGLVAAICARRRDEEAGGLTVLSCDNIRHNGDVLRAAVMAYADAWQDELAAWIDRNVAFPNAMVDRITPRPDAVETSRLRERTGIDDAAPIVCEPFRQWVLEDRAVGARPDLGRVGVQLVADVAPHERMKLWLLNASHLALAGPAELLGIGSVADAMRFAPVAAFVRALIERETLPAVGHVPEIDLAAYADQLIRRFLNPAIPDTPARINADAPISYLLDPLSVILQSGGEAPLLLLAVSFWLQRMRGQDEKGRPITIVHAQADAYRGHAVMSLEDVERILRISPELSALTSYSLVKVKIHGHLVDIVSNGAVVALERALGDLPSRIDMGV